MEYPSWIPYGVSFVSFSRTYVYLLLRNCKETDTSTDGYFRSSVSEIVAGDFYERMCFKRA